jgi:hypothetical protein
VVSRLVTGADVWPAIADLLQGSQRRVVATAFLGADACDLLSALGHGDLLVCDASKRAESRGHQPVGAPGVLRR